MRTFSGCIEPWIRGLTKPPFIVEMVKMLNDRHRYLGIAEKTAVSGAGMPDKTDQCLGDPFFQVIDLFSVPIGLAGLQAT